MGFFESESFDPIFQHIEELIGVPIKNIVIESRRSEARKYMTKLFPPEVRSAFASWGEQKSMTAEEREVMFKRTKDATTAVLDVGRVYGYAAGDLGELWEKRADYPWRENTSRNPYSLSLYLAESLGSCEAFEDRDMWVDCTLVGDTYHLYYYPSEHPLELKERLAGTRYAFKNGEVEYERCPECGIPREISRYVWDLERGSITNPDTGRRMAILGSLALDAVLFALEEELGKEINETIIEAQRVFTKSYWSNENLETAGRGFSKVNRLTGGG